MCVHLASFTVLFMHQENVQLQEDTGRRELVKGPGHHQLDSTCRQSRRRINNMPTQYQTSFA